MDAGKISRGIYLGTVPFGIISRVIKPQQWAKTINRARNICPLDISVRDHCSLIRKSFHRGATTSNYHPHFVQPQLALKRTQPSDIAALGRARFVCIDDT